MNKKVLKFYYLFFVPMRACFKYIAILSSVLFVALTFSYAVFFEIVLDQDIFKVSPEEIVKVSEWRGDDNTIIFDKNGEVISEQFNEYHLYLPYEQIPEAVIEAIVAVEDRKFWQHKGIDIFGIFRAAYSLFKNHEGGFKQGASTITQQVVKNVLLTKDKTITRKLREIVLSIYIEQYVPKEKIIEIYCNRMFLGNGAYGVGAAARRYFNKPIDSLQPHESAVIAGLFQLPGMYNPAKHPERAKKRQLVVLNAMYESGYLNEIEYEEYKEKEISYEQYKSTHGTIAPYFIDYVVQEGSKLLQDHDVSIKDSGLKIYTTLDQKLQSLGEETISNADDLFNKLSDAIEDDVTVTERKPAQEEKSEFDHVIDIEAPEDFEKIEKERRTKFDAEAAILVMDKHTGGIVTMVGGRDYSVNQFNRTANSLRAPGSVFKTFTYALGLKKGHQWNEMYYVTPITIDNYRPRTERAKLYSETTMLAAFYNSINSPAVLLGQKLGMHNILNFSKELGIETPLKDEAATLLGGSEVTMLDMARAYSTFANDGKRISPIAITKIEDAEGNLLYEAPDKSRLEKEVLRESTNELIVEGLKQVVRRGTGYAVRNVANYAAGKTGTSNDSKDNWFCGFTEDLVVIVWMGNDDQRGFKHNISAANTAAPLWSRFVKKSINHLKTRRLGAPRIISRARVNPSYGNKDKHGVEMYFLSHQLPKKEGSDLQLLENGEKLRVGLDEL